MMAGLAFNPGTPLGALDETVGDVDLVLSGTNLTDSVGRNAVSFTKDFVVLPGRTFRAVLHFAL